jgi:hypothetical protein
MDRMSRALWGIGVLGSLGILVSGASGFALRDVNDTALPRHVLFGLGSTLVVAFAHTWAALYLWGLGRAVAATAAEGGLGTGAAESARRLRRGALPWILLALAASILLFALGGAATTGALSVPAHQALAWGALLAQGAALRSERRALAATESLLRSGARAEA